jgi:hypothetical protein
MGVRIGLYLILAIPLIVFIVSFPVCFKREHKSMGLQYAATAVLACALFIFAAFDSGEVFKYLIQTKDGYSVSPRAIEQVILKNMDDLGLAIAKVYEEYYIVETFDCSKESDVVKFGKDGKGNIYFKLQLKYQPVEKTIQTLFSSGVPSPDTEPGSYLSKDLFYKIIANGYDDVDKLKRYCKQTKQITEIKYFRKK